MAIFRKPRRTEVLVWSVIFLIAMPAYIGLREAIKPLAVSQLGVLGVSLLLAVVPVAVFAWIFKSAPTGLWVVLTWVCYLIGAWCAFNIASVFNRDAQWGWAYGPQSWFYVTSEYVQVLDEYHGENFLAVTEAFFRVATGRPAEGDSSIAPPASRGAGR
ncbi:MAG: hypothetical protein ACLQVN_27415 [Bryobacteraceae bacterium]